MRLQFSYLFLFTAAALNNTVSACTQATCKTDGDYYNDGPDKLHYQLVNFDNILYSFNTLFMCAVTALIWRAVLDPMKCHQFARQASAFLTKLTSLSLLIHQSDGGQQLARGDGGTRPCCRPRGPRVFFRLLPCHCRRREQRRHCLHSRWYHIVAFGCFAHRFGGSVLSFVTSRLHFIVRFLNSNSNQPSKSCTTTAPRARLGILHPIAPSTWTCPMRWRKPFSRKTIRQWLTLSCRTACPLHRL